MQVAALMTVRAILERGSFAGAADEVGCTQSAVSLQVKQLERYFGQPLFDRSGRAAKPTPLAHEVAAIAGELAARLRTLRSPRLAAVSGRVRLGAIATVQSDALPQALRRLRERYPALEVEVTLDDSDALLAHLKAGRLDAAVLVRPSAGGSARLAWHDLARQPFVMLAPADAPEATPRDLLERLGWIRYDIALTGGRLAARYVGDKFGPVRRVMELRAIDAIVAMVSAGLGVSVVPRPRASLLVAHAVREVGLGRGAPTRLIALVRRGSDAENRRIDAVQDALAQVYAAATAQPGAPGRR